MVGQLQMAQDDGAAAGGAMAADARAAGDADAAGHRAVGADVHVVADLDQVVEFDALLDHGVVKRAAVNAGIGADLHIVANLHRAELLDLHPLTLLRRKAEAVGADHHAAVHDAARADAAGLAQRHAGCQPSGLADFGAGANMGVATDQRARPDHRASTDIAQRTDTGTGMDAGAGLNHRAGMNAGWRRLARARRPPLAEAGEVEVGVVADDDRATAAGGRLLGRRDDHASGLGAGQLRRITRIGQKAQAADVS